MERDVTGRVVPDSIEWDDAACKGEYGEGEDDLFFSSHPAKALEFCARCPIIDECRTYAIDHEENFGVWGGMSEAELRRSVRDAKKKPQQCEWCDELFHNRFSSKYCGEYCRDRAGKAAKRKRRDSAIPTDVTIQFSRRSA